VNHPAQSRDGVLIHGQRIPHDTLARTWVCGTCGCRLVTRYNYGWETVCSADPHHNPEKFLHRSAWAYVEARQQMADAQARDILTHLPADLQAAIQKGDTPCPSKV
jgi:hypothetical protein